ncbi:hypothetical protein FKW77_000072 [Venturia effusa]|uniref:Fungal N-terminal domain-containing protein n=1 Tax=Venturia effusa TaxID=50376 RepID=A0A517LA54_9PEZI|nr:hypothetical protein FKW77_000072 [Venturia effusa]
MSGLEVLGAAASIIQIADAGLKLYTYIDTVRSADKRLARVNKILKTTCNVVKEIGEVFQRTETAKIVSQSAVTTARDIAEECDMVFDEMRIAVKRSEKNKLFYPLKEGKLEFFSAHLEKMKSTLTLLMTVLIDARHLQYDRENEKVGKLIRANDAATVRYEELKRTHDLLFTILTSASMQAGPSFNNLPVVPTGANMSATRSPPDEAGELIPSGHSEEHVSVEALNASILKVCDLLKSLAAIKDAMNDNKALTRAKAEACMVYRYASITLDDFLSSESLTRQVYYQSQSVSRSHNEAEPKAAVQKSSGFRESKEKQAAEERIEMRRLTVQREREARAGLLREESRKSEVVPERAQRRDRVKIGSAHDTIQETELERQSMTFESQQDGANALLHPSAEWKYTLAAKDEASELMGERWEARHRDRTEQLKLVEDHLEDLLEKRARSVATKEMTRTTPIMYTTVRSSHLDERTLKRFNIRWKRDMAKPDIYIIQQEVNQDELDALFKHTRLLKQLARLESTRIRKEKSPSPTYQQMPKSTHPVRVEETKDEVNQLLREWTTLFDD